MEQILADYPQPEADDVKASLGFGGDRREGAAGPASYHSMRYLLDGFLHTRLGPLLKQGGARRHPRLDTGLGGRPDE